MKYVDLHSDLDANWLRNTISVYMTRSRLLMMSSATAAAAETRRYSSLMSVSLSDVRRERPETETSRRRRCNFCWRLARPCSRQQWQLLGAA